MQDHGKKDSDEFHRDAILPYRIRLISADSKSNIDSRNTLEGKEIHDIEIRKNEMDPTPPVNQNLQIMNLAEKTHNHQE